MCWHFVHWRRARQAVQTAAEHTDEKTTLVIGSLTYAGIGYRSTGDQWLALTAAAQAREQRRVAKEERMTQLAG